MSGGEALDADQDIFPGEELEAEVGWAVVRSGLLSQLLRLLHLQPLESASRVAATLTPHLECHSVAKSTVLSIPPPPEKVEDTFPAIFELLQPRVDKIVPIACSRKDHDATKNIFSIFVKQRFNRSNNSLAIFEQLKRHRSNFGAQTGAAGSMKVDIQAGKWSRVEEIEARS